MKAILFLILSIFVSLASLCQPIKYNGRSNLTSNKVNPEFIDSTNNVRGLEDSLKRTLQQVTSANDSTPNRIVSSSTIKGSTFTNRYNPQWPFDIRIGAGRSFIDGTRFGLVDDTTGTGQSVNVGYGAGNVNVNTFRNAYQGYAAGGGVIGHNNFGAGFSNSYGSIGSYNTSVGSAAYQYRQGSYGSAFGYNSLYTGSNGDSLNSAFGAWSARNFRGVSSIFLGPYTTVIDTNIVNISTATFGGTNTLGVKGTSIATFITATGASTNDVLPVKLTFSGTFPVIGSSTIDGPYVVDAKIISSDSLSFFQASPFNAPGSYTGTIATSPFLRNASVIGPNAMADRSNQMTLGSGITQLKINGTNANNGLRFDVSNEPTLSGTAFTYNAINKSFGLDTLSLSPNLFKGLGYSDTKKINLAASIASLTNKPLRIGRNDERGTGLWGIDSAILLSSNTHVIIENATLKLTNSSRDNIFRSANAGLGITNPEANPLSNITIEGVGNAVLEGADNPRATGDNGKTLALIGDLNSNISYGTDSGVVGQSQVGDWRNIGAVFAYVSNIKVTGITLHNMHSWAISFERCDNILVRDITLNSGEKRSYANYVKNTDGVNFRNGCHDFTVENIRGTTGDDAVALTLIPNFSLPAGSLASMHVSKIDLDTTVDNIYNFTIRNVKSNTYHNIVRLLNTGGAKIYNGTITDVQDITINDSLVRKPTGSVVVLGSVSGGYGGPTPVGNLRNINIDNVICKNYPYAVNVQGSIAESSIRSVFKDTSNSNPAIYFHPSSFGARNLQLSNIFDASGTTDLAVVRSGTTAIKSGLVRTSNILTIIDSALTGFKYAANYASNFTARSLIDKNHADSLLLLKRNISDTAASSTSAMTIGQGQHRIDSLAALKAPLASPTFTGTVNTANLNLSSGSLLRWQAGNVDVTNSGNDWLVKNFDGAASTEHFRIKSVGNIAVPSTLTAAGTTGAQTINKVSGTVNFAASATSLVVTNSLVATSSIIFPVIMTNDATASGVKIVPASGSFTIYMGTAPTAETKVGFFVIN